MNKTLIRFLYHTWYGSPLVFLVLAIVLPFAVSALDAALPRSVALGKDWAFVLLLVAFANYFASLVAARVRQQQLGCARIFLLVPFVLIYFFSSFLVACAPVRMASSPNAEWVAEFILPHVPVGIDQLEFCGGLDAREPIVVFEVKGAKPDLSALGFGEQRGARLPQRLFARFRHPIDIPADARQLAFVPSDIGSGYWLDAIVFADRMFLVYRRL